MELVTAGRARTAVWRRGRASHGVLLVAVTALALGGCGGGSGAGPATPPTSPSTSVVTTSAPEPSSATPSPTPTATATPLESGALALTADQRAALCSEPDGSSSNSELTLLPGASALVVCQGETSRLLHVDLTTGTTNWERALDTTGSESGEVIGPGTDHVALVESVSHPAEGLNKAFVTRTLRVLDTKTGEDVWTADLEGWIPKGERSNTTRPDVQVYEGPGRDAARNLLVVNVDGWTAFEAGTGSEVWHRGTMTDEDGAEGVYTGAGIALVRDPGGINGFEAFDAGTGKIVWTKRLPDIARDTEPVDIEGTAWMVGDDGMLAFDLRTARLSLNRKFPAEWTSVLATPERILAFDGSALGMYKPTDVRTPLWSVPGENAEPQFVASGLAVVRADSGTLVLDATDGSERTDVAALQDNQISGTEVDGLVELSDGSVLAVGTPGQ